MANAYSHDMDVYEIPVRDARGQDRTLGEYHGEVLLIVNTASY